MISHSLRGSAYLKAIWTNNNLETKRANRNYTVCLTNQLPKLMPTALPSSHPSLWLPKTNFIASHFIKEMTICKITLTRSWASMATKWWDREITWPLAQTINTLKIWWVLLSITLNSPTTTAPAASTYTIQWAKRMLMRRDRWKNKWASKQGITVEIQLLPLNSRIPSPPNNHS